MPTQKRLSGLVNELDVGEMKPAKYFLPQARLNKGQRKYCHCLMRVRANLGQKAYPVCKYYASRFKVPAGESKSSYWVNTQKVNCVMNYQYSDYSLKEVQAFCTEKHIPITYLAKDGTTKYYSKNKLVEFLTRNYYRRSSSIKRVTDRDVKGEVGMYTRK